MDMGPNTYKKKKKNIFCELKESSCSNRLIDITKKKNTKLISIKFRVKWNTKEINGVWCVWATV